MTGKFSRWYATQITEHSKLVILAVLLLTGLVTAGVAMSETEDADLGDFEVDAPETEAQNFIQENYPQEEGVVSQIVVRDEGGNVLTRESLLEGLYLQQEVNADDELAATLDGQGMVGIENLVGTGAVFATVEGPPPTESPTLDEQITALEELDDQEFEDVLAAVLDPDGETFGDADPFEFLPREYVPGETRADARLTLLLQVDESGEDEQPQAAYDAQLEIAELLEERFDDAFIFGQGINDEASANATGDSFAIITPFALILVLFVLGVAYRDPLDILLAIFGIGVVMAWLAGIMGWLAIPMNVILIAVPFLLIGLSIDYALHVVMRYREARRGVLETESAGVEIGSADTSSRTRTAFGNRPNVRSGMAIGLGSVVLALAAATFSTGVGFLSNVVSPLPAIQDFAVLSAGGILATFVAFGVLLPALKVEVDGLLEERLGWGRDKPAFGVESGVANRVLAQLGTVTTRIPLTIIVVALLLTAGGVYGATTIDTEFNEADFLPQDAPAWAEYLPGPLEPGTYTIADDFEYLSTNFQLGDRSGQSEILIREDVTNGALLGALDAAGENVSSDSSIQRQPDGTAAVTGPHTVIRDVAAENETVAAAIEERDTTGDELPDEDLESFYAILFDADEAAASEVVSRTDDGEITSARLVLSVQSAESAQTITDDTRAFATLIENDVPGVTAIATGAVVANAVVQDALLDSLVDAFVVTLVVILVFLTILFWIRYRSYTHGALILLPVVASLTWLLGTMALLDIPFNSETAVITSLAIGLGVDYSIHAGERFMTERERHANLDIALRNTITGTGGALLASAATTAAGFGVLALALSPPLQRFGIVTGAAIIFAFLAVVTVLPVLLVVRERLQPGGAYRNQSLRTMRRLGTPAIGLVVTAGALAAGAVGWYVADSVLSLGPVVSLTIALVAVLVVGGLGTPPLLWLNRRARAKKADGKATPILPSDGPRTTAEDGVLQFECPDCGASLRIPGEKESELPMTCIICGSEVDEGAFTRLGEDGSDEIEFDESTEYEDTTEGGNQ